MEFFVSLFFFFFLSETPRETEIFDGQRLVFGHTTTTITNGEYTVTWEMKWKDLS